MRVKRINLEIKRKDGFSKTKTHDLESVFHALVNMLLHTETKLSPLSPENKYRGSKLLTEIRENDKQNEKANLHDSSNYHGKREEPASTEHFYCISSFSPFKFSIEELSIVDLDADCDFTSQFHFPVLGFRSDIKLF